MAIQTESERNLTPYQRYKLRHGSRAKGGVASSQAGGKRMLHGSFNQVPVSPAEANELLEPPTDLSDDEQEAWRALAGPAIAEQTLTASRVPGFRVLCRRWAYCNKLDCQIRALGVTTSAADKLLRQYVAWQRLLSSSLGEFALHSFGRPATTAKPAQTSTWTDVAKSA